jgi:hypothetical protein
MHRLIQGAIAATAPAIKFGAYVTSSAWTLHLETTTTRLHDSKVLSAMLFSPASNSSISKMKPSWIEQLRSSDKALVTQRVNLLPNLEHNYYMTS